MLFEVLLFLVLHDTLIRSGCIDVINKFVKTVAVFVSVRTVVNAGTTEVEKILVINNTSPLFVSCCSKLFRVSTPDFLRF